VAHTVLIVDDQAVNRLILGAILEREGYQVIEAGGGAEALRLAERVGPSLILLDIRMPVTDGFDVLRELKANPATAAVPVIFISALDDASDELRGVETAVVDFIPKPFDPNQVLARVRTHLRVKELTEALGALEGDLRAKRARIEEDLRAAAKIQRALLPQRPLSLRRLDVAWRFEPCEAVAGDTFGAFRLDEVLVGLYVLAVGARGVPAVAAAVSVARSLRGENGVVVDPDRGVVRRPSEVLRDLDRRHSDLQLGRASAMSYMVLDTESGVLRSCTAGQPAPLVATANGAVHALSPEGPGVGLDPRGPFEEGSVRLEPRDRVALFTDGVAEREAPEGRRFGVERIAEVLAACRDQSLEEACDRVLAAVNHHAGGAPQRDDVAFLLAEYRA
jgi:sigma-B regulation protein RsbU (phosphoserine phosphatase)